MIMERTADDTACHFHLNVNVLNRDTLLDAMDHPENYPQLTPPRRTQRGETKVVRRPRSTSDFWPAAVRDGMLGSVHSWLVTAVDGLGTRLTIFLAGCALRCQYCHNPDTWDIWNGEDAALSDVLGLANRYEKIMKVTRGRG